MKIIKTPLTITKTFSTPTKKKKGLCKNQGSGDDYDKKTFK